MDDNDIIARMCVNFQFSGLTLKRSPMVSVFSAALPYIYFGRLAGFSADSDGFKFRT